MNLCEITKQLWEDYLIVRTPESLTRAMNRLAPDCVLIGTGKHEFYLSRERMQQALEVEVEQTRGCRFYIVDEWCQEMPLTEDVRLVYGGLRVRDAELSKPALVDMDSRYTLVYTRQGEDWVVRHGHQSLPYTEQAAGESYPPQPDRAGQGGPPPGGPHDPPGPEGPGHRAVQPPRLF